MNNLHSYNYSWTKIFVIIAAVFAIVLLVPVESQNLDIFGDTARVSSIKINGPISTSGGNILQERVTPNKVRSLTEKAEKSNPDAILYSINSPGGSVVASREIKRIIEDREAYTVCQFHDIAASGAFWASMGCDDIVSDSLTLTAGVGAKASYLEYSGLLDKLGIEYVNLTTGKYKEAGSPFRNISEDERRMLEGKLEEVKEVFLEDVAETRNLKEGEKEVLSDGRGILGREAKEIGVVDYLGGREKVKDVIKKELDVKKVNIEKIEASQGFNLLSTIFTRIGYGIGSSILERDDAKIKSITR